LFILDEPIDTNKGKKLFTEIAAQLMDPSQAGMFNQAMMEFGALQCIPSSPDCSICPLQAPCLAYAQKKVALYPVKQNKTKTKNLYLYYFHIGDAEHLYINRRTEKGIWQNLFEFPLIESELPLDFDQLSQTASFQSWFPKGQEYDFQCILDNKKHILSHRILYATFYRVVVDPLPSQLDAFTKIQPADIEQYPVHRLMQYYLENSFGYNINKNRE
jgi:A/G-specific adenine glycosylase